jgi:cation diffusion facilitator family transporter
MSNPKEQAALGSILASAGLTIAKGVIGFLSGSLALLSEAGHSLLDFVATIITYVAVRISGKPADDEHHYGHGKVESIAALAATALLFILSGVVIWEATTRLLGSGGHDVEATPAAFAVIIVSIAVDFWRAPALSGGGRNRERGLGGGCAALRVRHVVLNRGPDRPRRRRVWFQMG